MADIILQVRTEALLNKVASLAAEEIIRALGVKKDLRKLAEKLKMTRALLADARSKNSNSEVVQVWLKKLQSIAYDADNVLDDFEYEVLRQKLSQRKRDKVCCFFSFSNPILFRREMGSKIKDVNLVLEEAYKAASDIGLRPVELISTSFDSQETRTRTDHFGVASEIVGRDDDASRLVSMLISSDYKRNMPVIGIVGMPGQGKTTVAQLVFKDDKVVKHFEKRIWVYVSDDFKVERILNLMLESLSKNESKLTNRELIVNRLQEYLSGDRYLLVLDDVWNEDKEKWECLRKCLLETGVSGGSKILVTTRSDQVVSTMQTAAFHRLERLSDNYSWELFESVAFAEGGPTKTPELVHIGRRIVKRCGGVPLALKAIGGMLYGENDWLMIERSDIWSSSSSVFSAIKLTYDHLPYLSLKECFTYCSIFPKDTLIEKNRLIQFWMAQGLINPPKGSPLEMEDIGHRYFNMLIRCSLLQRDYDDSVETYCKMHDFVHDFALKMSENCCLTLEGQKLNSNVDAVHLTCLVNDGGIFKIPKGLSPKLRTLYITHRALGLENLIQFRYLHALIVDCWELNELLNEIGELKHLRILDISSTKIKTLPDSLTKLFLLQTLRVQKLDGIPKGFEILINLRHFCFGGRATCLLPWIGRLTNLRTLNFFVVTANEGCQIQELEHLHKLNGELRVYKLENVSNYEAATKANFSSKPGIYKLDLHWDDTSGERNDMDVLDGLKPHTNLKILSIEGYQSPNFPSWMVRADPSSILHNLVEINLRNCNACEELPPLGHLSSLERVYIDGMNNVKRIGSEFYSFKDLDCAKSSSDKSNVITIFPALRILQLLDMKNVTEWLDIINCSSACIEVSPFLELLWVSLPNLSRLPDLNRLKSLESLHIISCQMLHSMPNMCNFTSLKELRIQSCDNLTHLPEGPEGIQGLVSLTFLEIKDCGNLRGLPDISCLGNLHRLYIGNCEKLQTLPDRLESLTALKGIKILYDPALWPKDLHRLTNLTELEIGARSAEIDYFPWPYPMSSITISGEIQVHFVSLTCLDLHGWGKIVELPERLQQLRSLEEFTLWGFDGLEALPEWLGSFESLTRLGIYFCKNLKYLPSREAMQRLSNLQHLCFSGCTVLKERCSKGSGPEWHKIAHISNVVDYGF